MNDDEYDDESAGQNSTSVPIHDPLEIINRYIKQMKPLKSKKNPFLAALLGFFSGGLGLVVYFVSIQEIIIILLIVSILSFIFPGLGTVGGTIIAAWYGYCRAITSNENLLSQQKISNENLLSQQKIRDDYSNRQKLKESAGDPCHVSGSTLIFCPNCGKLDQYASPFVNCSCQFCDSIMVFRSDEKVKTKCRSCDRNVMYKHGNITKIAECPSCKEALILPRLQFVSSSVDQVKVKEPDKSVSGASGKYEQLYCSYCGYHGKMKKVSNGSRIVLFLLTLCYLIPGVIYAIVKSGYHFECPSCRAHCKKSTLNDIWARLKPEWF